LTEGVAGVLWRNIKDCESRQAPDRRICALYEQKLESLELTLERSVQQGSVAAAISDIGVGTSS
jgi:hypothetical protein